MRTSLRHLVLLFKVPHKQRTCWRKPRTIVHNRLGISASLETIADNCSTGTVKIESSQLRLFGLMIASVAISAAWCFPLAAQTSELLPPNADQAPRRPSAIEIRPLLVDPLASSVPVQLASTPVPNKNPIGSPETIAWLKQIIRENLPPTYEDNRKWNLQREVWNGVHVKLDGLKLDTHRKRKLVNAGTWTRYTISFVEPDKYLNVEFQRLEPIDSAKIAFETTVIAPLDIHGQMAEWARDVKLYGFSTQAAATVKLTLAGTVQFQLNLLKLPPDITIKPVIDRANVKVLHFEMHRISRIGGDAAELLGKGMRRVVDERVEDMNESLVGKINRKLEKQSEKLSFSTQDWLMSKLPIPSQP
jgi:hypothetical protein